MIDRLSFSAFSAGSDIEGCDYADKGTLANCDFGDGADDVVFKLGLGLRAEEGNYLLLVERGDGGAKEKASVFSYLGDTDFIKNRGVFFIRVGLWIDEVQCDVVILGESGDFLEEVIDTRNIALDVSGGSFDVPGNVVVNRYGVFEFCQDGFGSLGQGETVVLGEIDVFSSEGSGAN